MDIRIPLPSMIRHQVQNTDYLWAQIVSNLISPPVVWAIWVYPIAFEVTPSQNTAFFHATVFTLLVCIMPMVYVGYMVKIGKIGDLHMRESHERYIPYAVSIVASCITMAVLYALGAHPVLLILSLISIVQLSIMLVGTYFNHISAHAMAITSVTSATALIFSLSRSYLIVPIIMLVVLARLVLNRHTPAQLIIGALIGILTPFSVIALLFLIL